MPYAIRKIASYEETLFIEGGKAAEKPVRLIGVAAVITNPWHGRGFVEDLTPEIHAHAPGLGELLTREIVTRIGSGDAVEAYGKAAIVGTAGEIEHASGFIHTLRFGNHFREAVGAKSYLSFTNKRGGPGSSIQIPMMHKHDEGMRSHYLTIEMHVPDAPAPDEIVVALGAATGGRVHPRIGNRYLDTQAIEAEKAARR
ncbi:MAG: amino acid synthesis family protein [Burkholderiales bacterium]|nr:amino acid synthesis family protein [Burkholderiales bacterium]